LLNFVLSCTFDALKITLTFEKAGSIKDAEPDAPSDGSPEALKPSRDFSDILEL